MTDIPLGYPHAPWLTPEQISQMLQRYAPTAEQSAVIAGPLEPTLVVAGAGAGKTETMAARVVWLVVNKYVRPDEVLGLTFTNKAARELHKRIRLRLAAVAQSDLCRPGGACADIVDQLRTLDPDISTYHAYAGALLSSYGPLLSLEPDQRLLSQVEVWQIAHRVVTTADIELSIPRSPATVTADVIGLAGELSEHLRTTQELREDPFDIAEMIECLPTEGKFSAEDGRNQQIIADSIAYRKQLSVLVDRFHSALHVAGGLDFSSQMALAAQLARDRPSIGESERSRSRAVLLDEYQDTGHSQRVLLSCLFGGANNDGIAVTAVGDPLQSIYGWRGASAANLPRFLSDFPIGETSAHRLELCTSWRNPRVVLDIANSVTAPLRDRSGAVDVPLLLPRTGAGDGDVHLASFETIEQELEWLAGALAKRILRPDGGAPSAAVLIRRNKDAAAIAAALRGRGMEVDVVGVAGLLDCAEVADVVALLTLVTDPTADASALRLLAGPHGAIAADDLQALASRARKLAGERPRGDSQPVRSLDGLRSALDLVGSSGIGETAALADAIASPGPNDNYTPSGYRAITTLAASLKELRTLSMVALTDLITEAEQALGVDVDVLLAKYRGADNPGRENLDCLHGLAATYSSFGRPTLSGFLAYLETADSIDRGLPAPTPAPRSGAVQILTIHGAKGLEWEIVAVPHVCQRVFPKTTAPTTWMSAGAKIPVWLRGDVAVDGDEGLPAPDFADSATRQELASAINDHKLALKNCAKDEDLRLFYVAVTRSESALLMSAHHWEKPGQSKPTGPSDFLLDAKTAAEIAGKAVVEHWAEDIGQESPLIAEPKSAVWPADSLGDNRGRVERSVERVRAATTFLADGPEGIDSVLRGGSETLVDFIGAEATRHIPTVGRWIDDVAALLSERQQHRSLYRDVTLPAQLSATDVVGLRTDPEKLARRLERPLPAKPTPAARRGTAFHAWVEHNAQAVHLLDIADLPGSADEDVEPDQDLDSLVAAFNLSQWSLKSPAEVEVPFEMDLAGHIVRGRIDAVYRDGDEWILVDWKTGRIPPGKQSRSLAVQLAVYRCAFERILLERGHRVKEGSVRAVFHYVAQNRTIEPANLLTSDELAEMITTVDHDGSLTAVRD